MKVSISIKAGHGHDLAEDMACCNGKTIDTKSMNIDIDKLKYVAIADGIGGNAGGRQASSFVMQYLADKLTSDFDESVLRELFLLMNRSLLQYGVAKGMPTMATIFTGLFCNDKCETYLVHTGNTRLAVFHNGCIKDITKDQTTYQWLLDKGEYEVAEHCFKSAIRGCLGGGNSSYASILEIRKVFDDDFPETCILTSDGIHDYVDKDAVAEILASEKDDLDKIKALIQMAGENTSEDDQTAIILRK